MHQVMAEKKNYISKRLDVYFFLGRNYKYNWTAWSNYQRQDKTHVGSFFISVSVVEM